VAVAQAMTAIDWGALQFFTVRKVPTSMMFVTKTFRSVWAILIIACGRERACWPYHHPPVAPFGDW